MTSEQRTEMRRRLEKNWWRTGNGDFIHIGFFAFLYNLQWLINLSVFVQGLLFKLPFRWSDSQNKFEPMSNSSADYLNYLFTQDCAAPWARRVSKEIIKEKISHYFSNEPNSEWVVELFHMMADLKPLGKWENK